MKKRLPLAATLLPLLLSIASCAAAPPTLVKLRLPAEFRDCAGRPPIPPVLDDRSAALLLLEYDDALSDCRGKLHAVWSLMQ